MKFEKGQSGNPAGRPPGSRNKLQEDFLRDFCAVWDKQGISAIERVASEDPGTFVKVAAAILPKEIKAEIEHRSVMRMPEPARDAAEWLNRTSSGSHSPDPKPH